MEGARLAAGAAGRTVEGNARLKLFLNTDGAGILCADQQVLRVENGAQIGIPFEILALGQIGGQCRLAVNVGQNGTAVAGMADR